MNITYVLGWISRGVDVAFTIYMSVSALLDIVKCVYLPEFVIADYLSAYL